MALILLLCVIIPQIITAMECPNGIEVHTTCYNRTHLLELKGEFRQNIVVNQLGMLRKHRTLYYSYEPVINDTEYSKVRFINLDDPSKFGEISSPKNTSMNFLCFDLDQDNSLIYFGGSDGVKKLNTFNKRLSHYSSRGKTIMSLFFKDNVYFVRYNELQIIYQEAGAFKSLLQDDRNRSREEILPKTTVKKFVISNDNTVVFISTQGLFAAKAEKNSQVYRLSKSPFFHGLAVDLDGEVYTWKVDGIYKVVLDTINPAQNMAVRVATIPFIESLTFDNDNSILYTIEKSLYRLVKSDAEQC